METIALTTIAVFPLFCKLQLLSLFLKAVSFVNTKETVKQSSLQQNTITINAEILHKINDLKASNKFLSVQENKLLHATVN